MPEKVKDLPEATLLISGERGLDHKSRDFRREGQGQVLGAGIKGGSRSSQGWGPRLGSRG